MTPRFPLSQRERGSGGEDNGSGSGGEDLAKRDFLQITDFSRKEIEQLFELSKRMKARGYRETPLAGKTLAMIFAKSSTRTRVSFEVGAYQLGGQALFLSSKDIQIGRGEPIPEINGLTDLTHPCQVLADVFTIKEQLGTWEGKRIAWVGDGNNMANAWLEAAAVLGFELRLACPEMFEPNMAKYEAAKKNGCVMVTEVPEEAVAGAHVVNTDVWASMGQEAEAEARRNAFKGYTVDAALMQLAQPDAIFLHCLPAHRGEEVTADVIEGPQSRVWDEAENRLHVQKALLATLMSQ